jgi:GH15 family glucan-1,4-alpha-glucosidase
LETRWRGPNGSATVVEAMPVTARGMRPQLTLIRHLKCTSGQVDALACVDPRLGLPGRPARSARRNHALICQWGSLAVAVQTFPDLFLEPGVVRSLRLSQGEDLVVLASLADRTPAVLLPRGDALAGIEETEREWGRWTSAIDYAGPFRDAVVRSLITLRLLTYSPSGAPVAAPTMGLPERIGGELNWDYRYAWPRDAGIGSGAFMAAGCADEAQAFLRWLEVASRLTLPRMRVLYTLDGTPGHHETELEGLSGYRGSLPVRAANAAATQHQLDVYGWVVDTAWHLSSMGSELDGPSWRMIRNLADFVATHWRAPDAGIWEVRGEPRQHVSSKLMAFVALDRAARIARQRRNDAKRAARWEFEQELVRRDVKRNGWNDDVGVYTASYDSAQLDASLLILPMSELEEPHSERVVKTIETLRSRLSAGGVLLYRNLDEGGAPPSEGAFLACTFWLIDALARCGRVDDAETLLADAVALGAELGLLAEEIDPVTGEMLGNYPQALSHSTLVAAAFSLEEARASRRSRGSRRRGHEHSG